jgi:hypothetical protein
VRSCSLRIKDTAHPSHESLWNILTPRGFLLPPHRGVFVVELQWSKDIGRSAPLFQTFKVAKRLGRSSCCRTV